ncbi:MAG: hypothetical protein NTW86_23005 [Candidatus Sumerlaeota bacterium]|nr:hypothetical protein [Candidatus Sumerlaeota bacterium]
MKAVRLTSPPPSVADLLSMAREDVVLVTTEEGDSFVISSADELESEAQILRRNREFLALLDELKKDAESVPFDEAYKQYR